MTRRPARVLGRTGRRAEWVALACLHNGVFTRVRFQMTGLRVMPRLEVKTTREADSQMTPVAIHRGMARDSFAAVAVRLVMPGRRGKPGRTDRNGSDPPVRGPGAGSDAGVFSHPCPRPLGSLPIHQSLRGKPV